jgi:hypothetical protein
VVSYGAGIQQKSVSCPHIIQPASCTGGWCWFTLAFVHTLASGSNSKVVKNPCKQKRGRRKKEVTGIMKKQGVE